MTTTIGGLKLIEQSTFLLADVPEQASVVVKFPDKPLGTTGQGAVVGPTLTFTVEAAPASGEQLARIEWKGEGHGRIKVGIWRPGEWPGPAAGFFGHDAPVRVGRAGPMELFFQLTYARSGGATLVHFMALMRDTDVE